MTRWSSSIPTDDIILGICLISPDIVAIAFNLFVIVISVKHRKSLHPSDAFIVFLAFSDLGHPLLGYPMSIIAALQHGWNFGYLGAVHGFLGFLFGVASMTCLACMSVSRLLCVARPTFARAHGRKTAGALLTFSSLNAVFWASCPLLGWGRYGLEPYRTSCTLQWDHPDLSYVTASFLGCLALPALLMAVSYGHVTRLALAAGRRRRQWGHAASAAAAPQQQQHQHQQQRVHASWSAKEMRLFKLTILMCSVFLLAWAPYSVFALLSAYARSLRVPLALTPLAALAAKSSHLLDPVIYCALNSRFRRLFPRGMPFSSSSSSTSSCSSCCCRLRKRRCLLVNPHAEEHPPPEDEDVTTSMMPLQTVVVNAHKGVK
ncbi:visual pigment-like receptor peropsin [Babylonia areolata]|uniref:visual pigment-like receptor peropsin n=1 Tax=Babylonia areolata TaxID=304850 RepID=UPI003FD3AEE3